MLPLVRSGTPIGIAAHLIEAEIDVHQGLPAIAAPGLISSEKLKNYMLAGEFSLDGRIKPVYGASSQYAVTGFLTDSVPLERAQPLLPDRKDSESAYGWFQRDQGPGIRKTGHGSCRSRRSQCAHDRTARFRQNHDFAENSYDLAGARVRRGSGNDANLFCSRVAGSKWLGNDRTAFPIPSSYGFRCRAYWWRSHTQAR